MTISVEWEFPGKGWRALSRSTGLPATFTVHYQPEGDHPVDINIEVVDGAPVVDAVAVYRHPDRPSLTGAELRRIPMSHVVDVGCRQAALLQRGTSDNGDASLEAPGSEEEQRQVTEDVRLAQRRSVSVETLREVARIYRANVDDHPTTRVAEAFDRSTKTAARYVQLARKHGLLGRAPGPGKAGEVT